MDLPRKHTIRASSHRIINPFSPEKLAILGRVLPLRTNMSFLDLACGKGEMLCTWARDHGIVGTGVDISTIHVVAADERAAELGVADRVSFIHGNASGYVATTPVDVATCIGATWIGDGVAGTIELLDQSLRPGGLMLIGEPYWRLDPDETAVEGCRIESKDEFRSLPGLVGHFGDLGWDLVEMVLASQDSWDRYSAAHWINIRTWLAANPDDELAVEMQGELTTDPLRYVTYTREYLGWGVFALMKR